MVATTVSDAAWFRRLHVFCFNHTAPPGAGHCAAGLQHDIQPIHPHLPYEKQRERGAGGMGALNQSWSAYAHRGGYRTASNVQSGEAVEVRHYA